MKAEPIISLVKPTGAKLPRIVRGDLTMAKVFDHLDQHPDELRDSLVFAAGQLQGAGCLRGAAAVLFAITTLYPTTDFS